MSNKLKINQIIEREYDDPRLDLKISLPLTENSMFTILFTYSCPSCGGYGCHNGPCDNSIYLENNNNVRKTIGDEQANLLIQTLHKLIDKIK